MPYTEARPPCITRVAVVIWKELALPYGCLAIAIGSLLAVVALLLWACGLLSGEATLDVLALFVALFVTFVDEALKRQP